MTITLAPIGRYGNVVAKNVEVKKEHGGGHEQHNDTTKKEHSGGKPHNDTTKKEHGCASVKPQGTISPCSLSPSLSLLISFSLRLQ